MGELVRVDDGGAVRTVTLARPERRNALNAPMLEELTAMFAVDPPAAERVTVIRAEGPVFCAGVDLKERDSKWNEDNVFTFFLHCEQTPNRMSTASTHHASGSTTSTATPPFSIPV